MGCAADGAVAERSLELRGGLPRQGVQIGVQGEGRGAECRFGCRGRLVVVGTNVQAIIAAEDAVAQRALEFLRDATLPLDRQVGQAAARVHDVGLGDGAGRTGADAQCAGPAEVGSGDRKSTRLNSSHTVTSYAVFCLKKKKSPPTTTRTALAENSCARPRRPHLQ